MLKDWSGEMTEEEVKEDWNNELMEGNLQKVEM